jgi:hypothetical protein
MPKGYLVIIYHSNHFTIESRGAVTLSQSRPPPFVRRKIAEIGPSRTPKRDGRSLWAFLRPRLRLIVRMQAQVVNASSALQPP